MKQKQYEEVEELAQSIASEIACEENEAMCRVFAQYGRVVAEQKSIQVCHPQCVRLLSVS